MQIIPVHQRYIAFLFYSIIFLLGVSVLRKINRKQLYLKVDKSSVDKSYIVKVIFNVYEIIRYL